MVEIVGIRKQRKPSVNAVAVEPSSSPELSGGQPRPKNIQGIGVGFVPEVLNTAILDAIIPVEYEDAVASSRRLAREQGVLVGISAGAVTHAAFTVARGHDNAGRLIVAILTDTSERSLSTEPFAAPEE